MLEMIVVCFGNFMGEQIDFLDDKKKIMIFEFLIVVVQYIVFVIGLFEYIQFWFEFRMEEVDEKFGVNVVKIYGYCFLGCVEEVFYICQFIVVVVDYFVFEFGCYLFDSYKVVFVEDMV